MRNSLNLQIMQEIGTQRSIFCIDLTRESYRIGGGGKTAQMLQRNGAALRLFILIVGDRPKLTHWRWFSTLWRSQRFQARHGQCELTGTNLNIKLSFLIVILSVISGGVAQAFTLPGPLVSADWLAKNKFEVQIIEVATNFDSFMNQPNNNQTTQANKRIVVDFGGHIEGSVLMDFSTVRVEWVINGNKVNYLIPTQADFQKIVQSTGVKNDKPIVLVPFGQNHVDIDEALRILWQFKV